MNVVCNCNNRNLIVKIIGEIDHHTSIEIKEKLDKEITRSNAKNIVFDFSEINFMDSSGIGMLLGRYKIISQMGGKLLLVSVNSSLNKIFQMSGLYKIMNKYDDMEKALSSLQ